ncbi:glycolate oxidase subunit GlcE [Zwartia vadi]|uniref:glycolate oxidase subunit GlcE n=1 Tax=Zwartia vadi TaxID=3058168 RepID=UPI0025B49D04|nr:glycolate oxidase subunit GlcE [Zwartia vadi]MDN3986282.1 glycolate oxidase subunit GlcE [Zwartia vadi]
MKNYEISQLVDQVLAARASFKPVLIRGGGTKAFYGNPFEHRGETPVTLDMRSVRGIVNYHPSELVMTALAGTPLQEIIDTLDASGQMLAFDPPAFGTEATIGGCVSAGLAGPGRQAAGPLKDYVLGAHLLDAQGRVLKFGGEVMKNVAGYDVSRLLTGAMGMFGALTQVSIKVAPKPFEVCTLEWDIDEPAALDMVLKWRAQPLPISATSWEFIGGAGRLRARLAGASAALRSARQVLGGDLVDSAVATRYWSDLREQALDFFSTPVLWRIACAPGTPVLGVGPTLIEWGGGQRWVAADCDPQHIRRIAEQAGGHATLFRQNEGKALPPMGVFHPLSQGAATIVRRLKQEFDPKSLFNPGRLIAGL